MVLPANSVPDAGLSTVEPETVVLKMAVCIKYHQAFDPCYG